MASNSQIMEDPCPSETDEETIALKKKRSRRVSFADREITSVHIFNRDEDYETPPSAFKDSTSAAEDDDVHNEVLGFFRDLADSDDSKEMSPTGDQDHDEDEDVIDARKSFLRPIESPSPGSSIIGSATSNDEDNFFGPVSASFIRPGRLSDSCVLNENHDVTMDSTAFSMHYNSLARSDSGGELKTPKKVCLGFEEKTPTNITTPSDPGSFMVLTKVKKSISQNTTLAVEKVSGSRDSNDMSLVGENLCSYDYGKLSPALEALLAEGGKDFCAVPLPDSANLDLLKTSQISMFDENVNGDMDQKDDGDKEMGNCGMLDISAEGVPACMELDEANDVSVTAFVDQMACESSSDRNEDFVADVLVDHQIQTPNQLSKVKNDHNKAVIGTIALDVEFPAASGGTPRNVALKVLQLDSFTHDESGQCAIEGWQKGSSPRDRINNNDIDRNIEQHHGSPLAGSISSLSTKWHQITLDATKSCGQLSYVTPSPKQPNSFLGKENIKSGEFILSNHKSSSKLKIFEPSPHASALKDGIEKSKARLSKFLSSVSSPFNSVVKENGEDVKGKHVDAPISNLEKHLLSVDLRNRDHERTSYVDIDAFGTPKNIGSLSKHEGTIGLAEGGEPMIHISARILSSEERATQSMMEVVSSSQLPSSHEKVRQHILMPQRSTEGTVLVPGPDSSLVLIKLDQSPFKKELIPSTTVTELNRVPFRKDPYNASNNNNLQSLIRKEIQFPKSKSNVHSNNDSNMGLNSQSQFPAQDVENTSGQKRSIEETVHSDKISRIKRSATVGKSQDSALQFALESSNGSGSDKNMIGGDTTMKHWKDISLKFSADMKELFPPSIDELNMGAIDMLQDILAHLQKIEMYEMLCSQIQSQRACDESSSIRQKRLAETRLLLYKLVYEKARLQLVSVRRDKLLKRRQLLSSAIQGSQALKLNHIWHRSVPGDRDTSVHDTQNSCVVNFGSKLEVSSENVVTMRHEIEALHSKIKNLTKYFHGYCKMKGEPSCSETMVLLSDHLKKRTSCRFIHEDLQLWDVEDLGSRNGQLNIVLNYQGFIQQRFTISAVPVPSMAVSNKLNEENIMKSFPNINACLAFEFVLNAERSKKYDGTKNLAEETQMTSLLLHNLLDVVEEVQLARIEIQNLVQSSFHSYVDRLDLELCFADFNSGGKVMVTLDMTCLNCGLYPVEILPCQFQACIAGMHKSLPGSLSAEIKAAVDSLGVGYSRIMRLCRCISRWCSL